ncbi:hypothetical protein, partial [Erysipelothrix inopinata]
MKVTFIHGDKTDVATTDYNTAVKP